MTRFQLIVSVVFGLFALAGVIAFATFRGGGSLTNVNIAIWGTFPRQEMIRTIKSVEIDKSINVQYVEKDKDAFDNQLAEAISEGIGPDIIILQDDSIIRHRDKLYTIPYTSFPKKVLDDVFIDESAIYLTADGILGIPFLVDPLITYWDKDRFQNMGLTNPPVYWDELPLFVDELTERKLLTIEKTGLALGAYSNINNSKEILTSLMMQVGSPIISVKDGKPSAMLKASSKDKVLNEALDFYTSFSNPVGSHYSWNTSLSSSREMFLKGDLALYMGFASEYRGLIKQNPNLRIGIAMFPQTRGSRDKITYARIYALSILKSSPNIDRAFDVSNQLTSDAVLKKVSEEYYLPSVGKADLFDSPTDPVLTVFNRSAIRSRTWLDPSRYGSSQVFRRLIENIMSGRFSTENSVKIAEKELNFILPKKI